MESILDHIVQVILIKSQLTEDPQRCNPAQSCSTFELPSQLEHFKTSVLDFAVQLCLETSVTRGTLYMHDL